MIWAAALAENRARDMAAGRSLIGPHRADLRAVWAAKGVQAAPMFNRRTEGIPDFRHLSVPGGPLQTLAVRETAMPPLLLLDMRSAAPS